MFEIWHCAALWNCTEKTDSSLKLSMNIYMLRVQKNYSCIDFTVISADNTLIHLSWSNVTFHPDYPNFSSDVDKSCDLAWPGLGHVPPYPPCLCWYEQKTSKIGKKSRLTPGHRGFLPVAALCTTTHIADRHGGLVGGVGGCPWRLVIFTIFWHNRFLRFANADSSMLRCCWFSTSDVYIGRTL